MKRYLFIAVMLLAVSMYAEQKTEFSQRDVRDPRRLEIWLEANASDAETRIDAVEELAHTVTITNVDGEDGEAVATVEIRDGAGAAVDACVEFWLSDSDGGAPASQTATASVGTAGTAIETINADYQYRALTASGDLDIDLATDDEGFVVVIYKSEVYSAAFAVTTSE